MNKLVSLTWSDFKALTKIRLAFSVVFSSLAGYLLAAYKIDAFEIYLLLAGGFFLVAASNIYNQVIEIQLDAKMQRTSNRPLPKGRVHPKTKSFLDDLFQDTRTNSTLRQRLYTSLSFIIQRHNGNLLRRESATDSTFISYI